MVTRLKPQGLPSQLDSLWRQAFFQKDRTLADVAGKLAAAGSNPTSNNLNIALSRAKFLRRRGKSRSYRYIQKAPAKAPPDPSDILPDSLLKKLSKDFKTEVSDLRHNYGISGTCTAFLLRKILEKLIFLAFAANGQEHKLNDANGTIVGLGAMLSLASSSKVAGRPFLLQKTANAIQGVKFLGDSAAHNPLADVSMQTIQPNMPYIITAYEELANKL